MIADLNNFMNRVFLQLYIDNDQGGIIPQRVTDDMIAISNMKGNATTDARTSLTVLDPNVLAIIVNGVEYQKAGSNFEVIVIKELERKTVRIIINIGEFRSVQTITQGSVRDDVIIRISVSAQIDGKYIVNIDII